MDDISCTVKEKPLMSTIVCVRPCCLNEAPGPTNCSWLARIPECLRFPVRMPLEQNVSSNVTGSHAQMPMHNQACLPRSHFVMTTMADISIRSKLCLSSQWAECTCFDSLCAFPKKPPHALIVQVLDCTAQQASCQLHKEPRPR